MDEVIATAPSVSNDVADILRELFNFDGQIEELCAMSEMEGQFGMSAEQMLDILHEFCNRY